MVNKKTGRLFLDGLYFYTNCAEDYRSEILEHLGGEVRNFGVKIKKINPETNEVIDWEKEEGGKSAWLREYLP